VVTRQLMSAIDNLTFFLLCKELQSYQHSFVYSFLQSLCYYFQNVDVTFFKTLTVFSIAWIQYT